MLEMVELDGALDWAPACDGVVYRIEGVRQGDGSCEQPARWIGTSLCCGRVKFYCEEHRTVRQRFSGVLHQPCGKRPAPVSWAPLGGVS